MAADVIPVGGSYLLQISGLTNAATGALINDATVTWALKMTSDDSAVSGASGAMTATGSGGIYQATIAAATTATLTAGASYYALMTPTEGSISDPIRLDLTAQLPGMEILSAQDYLDYTGLSYTGADLVSLQGHCEAVSEALERMCYPILLRPKTLALFPFDAPAQSRELMLPRPIRSISAIYYRCNANGDNSVLDLTADLLTAGADYRLVIDDVLTGWSRSGIVQRVNRSAWGGLFVRPPTRLGYRLDDEPGSVFVSGSFGPDRVSPVVRAAGCSAVSLMMQRRKTGAPLNSESFGGYSYSNAGQFTAEAAVRSPDVLQLLMSVGALPYHIG